MKGRIARIFTSFIDVPDAIAVAIFFSGCSIRCKGCQNKDIWDPTSGTLMSDIEVLQKVKDNTLADCVAFLGGEPTDQLPFLLEMCSQIKQHTKLPIALYTGREFEDLPQELLDHLFMVVCGPYREDLQKKGWPASSNQRVFKKKELTWGI
ncbi:MAG: 4Fe-4S cluster-binding domain-containing protein [bacterium]